MEIASIGSGAFSPFDQARQGMRQAEDRLDGAAQRIAKGDLNVKPMVDLVVSERMYAANAKVVKTQDEMLGTLLDAVG